MHPEDLLIKIKKPVQEEIRGFESYFAKQLQSPVPLLGLILNRFARNKGKQIRPLVIFLTARMCGNITQKTYVAAAMVELLHIATLVHDDIVDEAYERRNQFSINALWKSKKAVLIGDYLLSRGLLVALENEAPELLQIIARAVSQMSEGELMQYSTSRKNEINIPSYFEVIRKKTASFFSASSECGAASATSDNNLIQKAATLGEWLGMIFQIKDDLFDYQIVNKSGKPSGNDLSNMKFTLPLLYAMEEAGMKKKSALLALARKSEKPLPVFINEFIALYHGFEDTGRKIEELGRQATAFLEDFPDNEARESFAGLIRYLISRSL